MNVYYLLQTSDSWLMSVGNNNPLSAMLHLNSECDLTLVCKTLQSALFFTVRTITTDLF